VSGLAIKGGILKGMEIEFESLRAFITGGIEFASPPGTARAKPGTVFFLYSEPKKEWLAWAPKIPIPPEK
jgi:paraquat-inducible protein B